MRGGKKNNFDFDFARAYHSMSCLSQLQLTQTESAPMLLKRFARRDRRTSRLRKEGRGKYQAGRARRGGLFFYLVPESG